MKNFELLAPAGNFAKLKTALYFGADAVYAGGKNFSLRALSDNFSDDEMREAVLYTHERNKKIYVAVNVLARGAELEKIDEYLGFLNDCGVDAVIVSDPGIISLCRENHPSLQVHLSTQASTTNRLAAKFWKNAGVARVVLARELSLSEVKDISDNCEIETEIFVHGAMCISYSGRCLLSEYFTGRNPNAGACAQCCRWEYELREKNRGGEFYPIEEDERGTYILNSKDLNLINYLHEIKQSGAVSLKIEGRMKSEYYLATVVNAYRRAIDAYEKFGENYKEKFDFLSETEKTAHREFTTAYALGKNQSTVNHSDSQSKGTRVFTAVCVGNGSDEKGEYSVIEMRNRFKKGDVLEVLSPSENFNERFAVDCMTDVKGSAIDDAKLVQQRIKLYGAPKLSYGDILRK